jgi:hypothetical protein
MNYFIHQNGLQIKRKDAFDLCQQQMVKNLGQRHMTMFSSAGVLTDIVGEGLSLKTPLKVIAADDNTLRIKAGYAISAGSTPSNSSIIVLPADVDITISDYITAYTGTAYVYIATKTVMAAAGKEIYLPSYITGSEHIYLLQNDSSIISISSTEYSNKTLLAEIRLDNSSLAFSNNTLTLNELSTRPYIDSDDEELTILESSLGAGVPSAWKLLIGEEYISYTGGLVNKTITLSERGYGSTVATIHRNGESITISPIIDMRQTNMARLSQKETGFIQRLRKGIISYNDGNGDRFIKTMRVPDTPNAPTISTSDITLIWLNKQTTGGNISETSQQKISQINGIKSRIENLTANIAATRESSAGASTEESQLAAQEIAELRNSLIEARVEYADAASSLQDYANMFSSSKKYVASCTITQPGLIDNEQIVRYEAEIKYLPVVSSAVDKMTGIPSQLFTPTLMPTGINSYGDMSYAYDEQPDETYRTLLIPIRPNESIKFRVRSISEYGMVSSWSSWVTYNFDELSTSDIKISTDLEKIAKGYNPYEDGIITAETLAALQEMRTDFVNGISQVQGYINDLAQLRDNVRLILADIISLKQRVTALESGAVAVPSGTTPSTST